MGVGHIPLVDRASRRDAHGGLVRPPGTGLSTGAVEISVADEASVSAAVLETLDRGPAALFGASSPGCASVALAATHSPDLVTRLALYGAYAQGNEITTDEIRDSLVGLVEALWGLS